LPEKHIRENAMSSIDRRTALALGAAATAGAAMPAAAAAAGEALGGEAMAGKSVLITGASSGFGQLAALLFARSGAKVFATMRNLPRAEADEMRKVAKAEQLDLTVLELDVLSDASVAKAVAEAEKLAGGGIDGVSGHAARRLALVVIRLDGGVEEALLGVERHPRRVHLRHDLDQRERAIVRVDGIHGNAVRAIP